jgi:site-specific recombinase XerD
MTVLQGGARERRRSPVEAAYEHFRLERQDNLVSAATLQHYDDMVLPFLAWADDEGAHRFEDLNVAVLRAYRAELSTRIGSHGRKLQPHSILDSHKALLTFFRWARAEGYEFDPRVLELQRPKVPDKEPDVYHIKQVKAILGASNPRVPQEDLIIRALKL